MSDHNGCTCSIPPSYEDGRSGCWGELTDGPCWVFVDEPPVITRRAYPSWIKPVAWVGLAWLLFEFLILVDRR